MKKRNVFVFVAVILVLQFIPLFSLYGCSKKLSPDMLKNAFVDLSDVKSLGISSQTAGSNSNIGKLSLINSVKAEGSETTNFFVKVNENDQLEKVVFYKSKTEINIPDFPNMDKIFQDDMDAIINKLYVSEKFTYISFVKKGSTSYCTRELHELNNPYSGKSCDYDRISYFCNDDEQSYVIDNLTGKIYSFANHFKEINFIDENQIHIVNNNTQCVYLLSIIEGNLNITRAINNTEINVFQVDIDKWGKTYIRNDKINSSEDGIVYYTHNNHILSHDKTMFYHENDNDNNAYICYYDEFGNKKAIDKSFDNAFSDNIYSYSLKMIKNGYGFYNNRFFTIVEDESDDTKTKIVYSDNQIINTGSMFFVNNFFYFVNNNFLKYFDINILDIDNIDINIMENCATLADNTNTLYYKKGDILTEKYTTTTLQKYRIVIATESGLPVLELYDSKMYGQEIIVIQPLN